MSRATRFGDVVPTGSGSATADAVLDASPSDLAGLLTGAMLDHLSGPPTYARWCLAAAHAELTQAGGSLNGALVHLRGGLTHALRGDQVEPLPETILLQTVYWLVSSEQVFAGLMARGADAHNTVSDFVERGVPFHTRKGGTA